MMDALCITEWCSKFEFDSHYHTVTIKVLMTYEQVQSLRKDNSLFIRRDDGMVCPTCGADL